MTKQAELQKEVKALKKDVAALTKTLKGAANESASNTTDALLTKIHDIAEQTGSKVRQLNTQTTKQVRDSVDTVETSIKKNPFRSAATAAGVGAVFGALITALSRNKG